MENAPTLDKSDCKAEVVQLSQEDITRAKEDGGEFYATDTIRHLEPSQKLNMAQTATVSTQVKKAYATMRNEKPGLSDCDIRKHLILAGGSIKSFAECSHPTMFKMITDRNTTQAQFEVITRLSDIRRLVESQEMTEDEAKVAVESFLVTQYTTPIE
jgi:hypothetical protein